MDHKHLFLQYKLRPVYETLYKLPSRAQIQIRNNTIEAF